MQYAHTKLYTWAPGEKEAETTHRRLTRSGGVAMNRELSFSWKSRWSADLTAGITEAPNQKPSTSLLWSRYAWFLVFFTQPEVIWKRRTSQPWELKRLVRSWLDGLGSCRRCGLDGETMLLGVWALRFQSLLLFPGGLPPCMLSLPCDADGLQPPGTKTPNTHFLL